MTASTDEGVLKITVEDHGLGIPDDEQPKIFTNFYRASNARATEPNGNGLGLYLVKALLEASGGTISFISKENVGSTFTITLPLKQPVKPAR